MYYFIKCLQGEKGKLMRKYIELNDISTVEAAKNFAKYLDENKTYFLNGSWGSGKTTFLKEVRKHTEKNMVYVDLWRMDESKNIMEFTYSKLYPIYYKIINIIFIILAGVAIILPSILGRIIMSNSTNNAIINPPNNSITITEFLIYMLGIVLLLGIFQFYKERSSLLYYFLLDSLSFNNKILIIDDFDRISKEKQKEAYKLFTFVKEKLPIIFVGDILILEKEVDNNFLTKIIDRRVELPYALHTRCIWREFFQKFEIEYGVDISEKIKERIVLDKRNLRDRKHLVDYINIEFIDRHKIGKVQVEQQLLMIYCYLFYKEYYNKLLDKQQIITLEESQKLKYTADMEYLLFELQNGYNETYPRCYSANPENYYIYESSINVSIEELEKIFEDEDAIRKEIQYSDWQSDTYQYFKSEYERFSEEKKQRIFEVALVVALDEQVNKIQLQELSLVNFIFEKSNLNKGEDNESTFQAWISFLETRNLDVSEQMWFVQKYTNISISDIGRYYNFEIIDIEVFEKLKRKDIYLLAYLSNRNIISDFEKWNEEDYNLISILNDNEFITFMIILGAISNNKYSVYYYDFRPKDKVYKIWEKKRMIDYSILDYTRILQKNDSRLKRLEKEGYVFVYQSIGNTDR